MSSRVIGKVVIKTGPAPSKAPSKGREQKWAHVYRAIENMRGGEWFKVPDELPEHKDRVRCVEAVRKWLLVNEIDDVRVYRSLDGVVVVCDGFKESDQPKETT